MTEQATPKAWIIAGRGESGVVCVALVRAKDKNHVAAIAEKLMKKNKVKGVWVESANWNSAEDEVTAYMEIEHWEKDNDGPSHA